ncbi:MAG: alanine racemase [Planctomycetota bacterium]
MAWRNRIEVSATALRHNVAAVRRAAGGRHLIAVVKANAYGLGLERCARIYADGGATALACVNIGEGERIRRVLSTVRVILMGSPLASELAAVVAGRYEPSLSTLDEVRAFAALAKTQAPLSVHVDVDTGMGRFGARADDAEAMVRAVCSSGSLRLAGISMHYAQGRNAAPSADQEHALHALLDRIAALPTDCLLHWHNSEGLLSRPVGRSNAVRVGLLLTGVVPADCTDPGVQPTVQWLSALAIVKHLPKGHGISYDSQHVLARDSSIGIIPVGYADGYPIALSNRGSVLIQGRRCPILGRVTMDYTVVDLTDLPRPVVAGEPVVLIGTQGAEQITIANMASLAGTIPYDVLCGFRGRCEVVEVA